MSRISRLQRDQVSPSAVNIYNRPLGDRGNVPNMLRTMAHRPETFESIVARMEAFLNTGTLPQALDVEAQEVVPLLTGSGSWGVRLRLTWGGGSCSRGARIRVQFLVRLSSGKTGLYRLLFALTLKLAAASFNMHSSDRTFLANCARL